MPTEEVSDVRTIFLAGITAAPSSSFCVRLIVHHLLEIYLYGCKKKKSQTIDFTN